MGSTKTLDDTKIKIQRIEALNKALGPSAALRFLTILHRDPTDYVQISRRLYKRQSINTLDVWFEKPRPCINEEVGNGVIVKKDEHGEIIGFEKINYLKKDKPDDVQSIPLKVTIV